MHGFQGEGLFPVLLCLPVMFGAAFAFKMLIVCVCRHVCIGRHLQHRYTVFSRHLSARYMVPLGILSLYSYHAQ